MRIEQMAVYTANLEYTGRAYAFVGGRSYQEFETTVVVLTTDTGLEGYGEVCPCGPNYMAAFAEGFRHIQIKLGHEVEADIDLVRRLGRLKQPDELWIGDINGAWGSGIATAAYAHIAASTTTTQCSLPPVPRKWPTARCA